MANLSSCCCVDGQQVRRVVVLRTTPQHNCFHGLYSYRKCTNQASLSPIGPTEVPVHTQLTFGHLRYRLTDVPLQPDSSPAHISHSEKHVLINTQQHNHQPLPPTTHHDRDHDHNTHTNTQTQKQPNNNTNQPTNQPTQNKSTATHSNITLAQHNEAERKKDAQRPPTVRIGQLACLFF